MTGTRKIIALIALFLSLLPGTVFILCDLLTYIEGPNQFLMAAIFIGGAPTLIVGILTFVIDNNKFKRKLIFTGTLIVFQISILPILWGINDVKLRVFPPLGVEWRNR